MKPIIVPTPAQVEFDFWRELAEIEAESIGWTLLEEGCYLHAGSDQLVIEIVGQASASMASSNVLWVV
jgi:hypothetical protein